MIMKQIPPPVMKGSRVLDLWGKLRLKSLLLPGGFVLGLAILLIRPGLLKISVSVVDLFFYSAFTVALLLAWRFHSGRVFSALIVLLLAHVVLWPCSSIGTGEPQCLTALEAISFLLPLN